MLGPVVRDASASFDSYWNSPSAYPMALLDPEAVTADALEAHRRILTAHIRDAQDSRYAMALREDQAIERMLDGDWPMQWTATWKHVSDDPLKVTMRERDADQAHVGSALAPMVREAQTQLSIISPYFVPGDEVTRWLVDAARSGRRVQILTNSLAANDVAAVHGGYSRYRKTLVDGGVRLWELKPLKGETVDSSLLGSSGAALQTKAFVADGRVLFVGGFNLDPSSTWLNCEQGVMVEDETLARQLEGIFAKQTAGHAAWAVALQGERLQWSDSGEEISLSN